MDKKKFISYACLAAVMLTLQLLVTHNLAPWIDEVIIADTAANYLLYGNLTTTATSFPSITLYQPLYPLSWLIWTKIFGFSLITSRLLNMFIEFLLGWAVINLYQKQNLDSNLSIKQICTFTVFYYIGCISISSLNGRGEALCALIIVLLLTCFTNFMRSKPHSSCWVFVLSALVLMVGIQASVVMLPIMFIGSLQYRNEIKRVVLGWGAYFGGTLLGLTLCCLLHTQFGLAKVYLGNIFFSSSTFRNVYSFIAPLLGDKNDKYGISQISEGGSFLSKCIEAMTRQPTTVFLAIGTTLLALRLLNNSKTTFKSKGVYVFITALAILCTLILFGRYTSYYQFFFIVPTSFALGLWVDEGYKWQNRFVLACGIIFLTYIIHPSISKITDSGYKNLTTFVERNATLINESDSIASPFILFYELRQRNEHVFFTEMYPCDSITHLKYIFMPIRDSKSDYFANYYNTKGMESYLDKILKDSTYTITIVDSLQYPMLRLYRIEHI